MQRYKRVLIDQLSFNQGGGLLAHFLHGDDFGIDRADCVKLRFNAGGPRADIVGRQCQARGSRTRLRISGT